METNPKLLPCAHCGSNSINLVREVKNDMIYWHVECESCGIRTFSYEEDESVYNDNSAFKAMEDAIDAAVTTWNTRSNAKNINPKPSINMDSMTNDELVDIAKKASDVLVRKANRLFNEIEDMMKDNHNKPRTKGDK